MFLSYHTNGLAHHDPLAALELLAETGYAGVSLTIDHFWLSPERRYPELDRAIVRKISELKLQTVVETGARFLLDPRRKHYPSLVAPPELATPRVELIQYACAMAEELGSRCVSLWSGPRPSDWDLQTSWDALAWNLERIMPWAERHHVQLGFEPEPGMFVDTVAAYSRLKNWVTHPHLKLTMDIGHLFCQGELPIAHYIQQFGDELVNVHLEDSHAGVHEHLMFGEGSIHFPPIIEALGRAGYRGPLGVELSRHSHNAAHAVKQAYEFLHPLVLPYQTLPVTGC